MSLPPGARLGPYEIVAPLGAGGMGEVYRARDARLKRDVAVKILPSTVSTDEERLARFAREAQVLAALSHPNIAGIYGLEETASGRALVMELVEGVTLAERLERGPISVDDAIPIALQIADALEAAHEKAIIHRDLKPANIAITPDGHVKVLDFGLAKALDPEEASDPSLSPTLTLRATQAGVILGTAAYMSPEQARGRAADKRTDVWAFGCVLYEMLTGKRAFSGEDVTDTIAAVVRGEPDWSALPADVPSRIELLIRRCLVKDRKQRISDIGVARFLMIETSAVPATTSGANPPVVSVSSRKPVAWGAGVGVVAGALLAAAGMWLSAPSGPTLAPRPMRFSIALPQPIAVQGVDRDIAIAPTGTHIAYRVGRQSFLMIRPIDQTQAQALASTAGARQPFFSPDGRWIGFVSGTELKKVSITGGPAITLCRIVGPPRGATWGDDDVITFATGDTTIGLQRVAAGGGEPTTLTTPNTQYGESDHHYPFALPGQRGLLFTVTSTSASQDNRQLAVFDQRTNQSKIILRGGSDAAYVSSGHIVYAAAGSLRAVRFDLDRLETVGDPVPVIEQLSTTTLGAANYSVSNSGILIYVPGAGSGDVTAERALVWVDRQGREEPVRDAPVRAYANPRLAPDGTRIALEIRDQEQDIWLWDFARRTLTRLTFTPALDSYPVWTRDSKQILFSSTRAGAANIYARAADGTGVDERLTTTTVPQNAQSVTPDGARLLLFENEPKLGPGVAAVTLSGPANATRVAQTLIQTTFLEWTPEVSPDGRWLAYASNESGQFEVYVRPFPTIDSGRWQVSNGGGTKPLWAHDGRELFFVDTTNNIIAVPVQTTQPTFTFGNPVKVVEGRYFAGAPPSRAYDVSRDGQRFLMIKDRDNDPSQSTSPTSLAVIINWLEEVNQRVGPSR